MVDWVFANHAVSKVVNITSSSLTVTSGHGNLYFPSISGGQEYRVVVEDRRAGTYEICKVTARTGDTMTITRAQEGTSSVGKTGDTIALRVTSAVYTDITSRVAAVEAAGYMPKAAGVSNPFTGDVYVGSGGTPKNLQVYGSTSLVALTAGAITATSLTLTTKLSTAEGGTGASTPTQARTNLGLTIGTNVQAFNTKLADIANTALSAGDILYYNGTNIVRLPKGTDDQVLTLATGVPSWADPAGVFSVEYTSGPQLITTSSLLTLEHGLGSKPKLIKAFIVCTTADNGYAIGDEVEVTLVANSNPGNNAAQGVYYDDTYIYVRFTNGFDRKFQIGNKTTGDPAYIDDSDWDFYVRAWA